jgi:N-acyl homoserine lactone hydrolase
MFLMQFGGEPVQKSISVLGGGSEVLWEPIIGIVVETDAGWILLETGIGRAVLTDSRSLDVLYPGVPKPWALDGEPLEAALADLGLEIGDLALAAVSHLHCDHTGGIPLVQRAGIPIAVHRNELSYARGQAALEDGYYPPDYMTANGGWMELDGDTELAPGVWAIATPGHAPGHMSYRVVLPESGTWLFAIDAADLGENLVDGVPPGQTVNPDDTVRAIESLNRLKAEAERLRARLVPGHDQFFWNAVRHPAGGHR